VLKSPDERFAIGCGQAAVRLQNDEVCDHPRSVRFGFLRLLWVFF
jgi:hypothetical protein